MKIKGRVICEKGKYIIARIKVSKLGKKVYSSSGRYIGRIVKIFGPVNEPYAKIKVERKWGRIVGEVYVRGDGNVRKKEVDR